MKPRIIDLELSKKFMVQIQKNGKKYHLGMFDNIEDAKTAYINKSKELHGAFGGIF